MTEHVVYWPGSRHVPATVHDAWSCHKLRALFVIHDTIVKACRIVILNKFVQIYRDNGTIKYTVDYNNRQEEIFPIMGTSLRVLCRRIQTQSSQTCSRSFPNPIINFRPRILQNRQWSTWVSVLVFLTRLNSFFLRKYWRKRSLHDRRHSWPPLEDEYEVQNGFYCKYSGWS